MSSDAVALESWSARWWKLVGCVVTNNGSFDESCVPGLLLLNKLTSGNDLKSMWSLLELLLVVDCFLARGFLSLDPFGRPTLTGCCCIVPRIRVTHEN